MPMYNAQCVMHNALQANTNITQMQPKEAILKKILRTRRILAYTVTPIYLQIHNTKCTMHYLHSMDCNTLHILYCVLVSRYKLL